MTDFITSTAPGLAVGLFAGLLHAGLLWRSTHRLSAWSPLAGILRMAAVAGLLATAAWAGAIIPAAAGWTAGFAATAAWLALRRSTPRNSAHRIDRPD